MSLTHNPFSEYTSAPQQVVVASPHLHGTVFDRKVVLVVDGNRGGHRGLVVNDAFRRSLVAARKSMQSAPQSRLSIPEPIELGVIQWGPGKLEDELRAGIWMATETTFESVLSSRDDLWANLVRGIGRRVLRESLGIEHFPDDVCLN